MDNSGHIRILTDSDADIPRHLVERYKIGILPIYVTVNQQQILVDGTTNHTWFYHQLASISSKPKTAVPSPQEFLRAFRKLTADGAQVIIGLFASASVSSIFDHANLAAREFTEASVRLIDTQQISMGLGWIVIMAAEALQRGASVEDIQHLVDDLQKRTYVFGVLDSMDYLHRSGRVGWTAAYMGDILKIKPVITFYEGEAKLLRKVRTRLRAMEQVVAILQSKNPFARLAILHSNADAQSLSRFRDLVEPLAGGLHVPVVNIGPVFASHVGPGCLGVACVTDSVKLS
jgi:DegV family protein with EDD domain